MNEKIAALIKTAAIDIADSAGTAAQLEAEILLAHALGCSRLDLLTHETAPSLVECNNFQAMINRRVQSEPIAYITGNQPFWDHDFLVSSHTLIPRQDTETLIEVALRRMPERGQILDLGTGSGCILLSLLAERPLATGLGLDVSPDTLALARQNARNMQLEERCSFKVSDWYTAVTEKENHFAAVVANPPYIPSIDVGELMADVRNFEPRLSLDGGEDGLACYRLIIRDAPKFLEGRGLLAVEVGVLQSNDVALLFEKAGFADIEITRDLPGVERVVSGKK